MTMDKFAYQLRRDKDIAPYHPRSYHMVGVRYP